MGTVEYKTLGNVKQFIETATLHAQGLVQNGIIFDSPIPAALKPLVRGLGPWPGSDDWAWDFTTPDNKGYAIASEEKARLGAFDTYQIVAKPPIEIAGLSYRVGNDDFRNGGMSLQIAAEKIRRPERDWNNAISEALLNVFTSGAYTGASAARTNGYAFTVKNVAGADVSIAKVTESANRATPTVAHASHLALWPDKQGGQFSAGHTHLPANAGGVWTEALGRTARDHLLEHPGVNAVDCYVGSDVVDDVFEEITDTAALTNKANELLVTGTATEDNFGVPSLIGTVDGVKYSRLDCLPANLAVYFARGRKPLGVSVGVQRADGSKMPRSWNDVHLMDPETGAVNYGFRGFAGAHVVEPTSIYIANYV